MKEGQRVKESKGLRKEGGKAGESSRGRGGENTAPRAPRPVSQPSTDHSLPTTYRLFYALRVPTEVSSELAQVQTKLKGNWRAVNPGQMHVTLSYLPAVPPGRVDDLKRLGARLMGDLPPMRVGLRGTGYFPNEGSPRVWFVKVEANRLGELAEQLRAGVKELGLETDNLPFKAHITLARKKGPAPRVPPLTFEQLNWTATSGTLYRSHLRKTGPIYEVESTFRFQGEPPPPSGPMNPLPPPSLQDSPRLGKNKKEDITPDTQESKE